MTRMRSISPDTRKRRDESRIRLRLIDAGLDTAMSSVDSRTLTLRRRKSLRGHAFLTLHEKMTMLKLSFHRALCTTQLPALSFFFSSKRAIVIYWFILSRSSLPSPPPLSFPASKDLRGSKPVADVRSHEFRLLVTKGKHDKNPTAPPPLFFLLFRRQNNFRGPRAAAARAIKARIFIKAVLLSGFTAILLSLRAALQRSHAGITRLTNARLTRAELIIGAADTDFTPSSSSSPSRLTKHE